MKPPPATGSIRITKVPDGKAPFTIRQQWQWLVLPCLPTLEESECACASCTKKSPCKHYGFFVPQDEALAVLDTASHSTAEWWRNEGYGKPDTYFVFGETEAVILSGVTKQTVKTITHVPEEAQGQITR